MCLSVRFAIQWAEPAGRHATITAACGQVRQSTHRQVCDQSGVTLRMRSRSQHYGGHLRSNNSLQSLINIAKLAENSTEALEFLRSKADIANVVRLTVGYCESESVSQQICTITACTVVQAVVKANSQSNAKGQISTPRGSKTPEQISMKLRLYNYIRRGCDHTCKSIWRCDNVRWSRRTRNKSRVLVS